MYLLSCNCERLCRICVLQIEHKKHVLFIDHADNTSPVRQCGEDHKTNQLYVNLNILAILRFNTRVFPQNACISCAKHTPKAEKRIAVRRSR